MDHRGEGTDRGEARGLLTLATFVVAFAVGAWVAFDLERPALGLIITGTGIVLGIAQTMALGFGNANGSKQPTKEFSPAQPRPPKTPPGETKAQ